MLRYLFWLCQFLLCFLLLGFTLKNSTPVAGQFFLGYQWQAPLVLVLLVFLFIGVALGILACLTYILSLRREITFLKADGRSGVAGGIDVVDHADVVA